MKLPLILCFFLSMLTNFFAAAQTKEKHTQQGVSGFVRNDGQFLNNSGLPDSKVLYKTDGPGYCVWVTEKGLTFQIIQMQSKNPDELLEHPENGKWERIDLTLDGASIKKELFLEEEIQISSVNYYFGHCKNGITNIHAANKLTIKNVYPGIDWILYKTPDGTFKYDFAVDSNADFNTIRLKYLSLNPVKITPKGNLSFLTFAGQFEEKAPVSFHGNKTPETSFNLLNQQQVLVGSTKATETTFGFSIPTYTRIPNQRLIIDPELIWGTHFGGGSDDHPGSTTTDSQGNLFITGHSSSVNFPTMDPSNGAYFQGLMTSHATYISKFSATGQLVWSTFYGGTSFGEAIEISPTGSLFVAGCTSDNNFPMINAGGNSWNQSTLHGMQDIFIVRFDENGVPNWSTYFGGNMDDRLFDFVLDNNGNLFLCGRTASTDFPTVSTNFAFLQWNNNGTPYDGFIVKLNSSLELVWSTYFGGTQEDILYGITTDSQGNVFFGGETWSSNAPIYNPNNGAYFQSSKHGSKDALIAKFSNNGALLWSTYLGGYEGEEIMTLTTTDTDEIWFAGNSDSNDFPIFHPDDECHYSQNSNNAPTEIFIMHITNSGIPVWSSYVPGIYSGYTNSEHLTFGSDHKIYLCGTGLLKEGIHKPACEGGFYLDSPGNAIHPFVMRFTPEHVLTWSTHLFDAKNYLQLPVMDANGNLFIVGSSDHNSVSSFPFLDPGNGAYFNNNPTNMYNNYILKFAPLEATLSDVTASPSPAPCNSTGSVQLSVSEGCPPFVFELNDGIHQKQTNCNTTAFDNLAPGDYIATVTSGNTTATVPFTISDYCSPPFVVPNVFTPNQSGTNDYYSIEVPEEVTIKTFQILNRWGEVVYTAKGNSISWDGTFNGSKCNEGVYYWKVSYSNELDTESIEKSGFLQLIR